MKSAYRCKPEVILAWFLGHCVLAGVELGVWWLDAEVQTKGCILAAIGIAMMAIGNFSKYLLNKVRKNGI